MKGGSQRLVHILDGGVAGGKFGTAREDGHAIGERLEDQAIEGIRQISQEVFKGRSGFGAQLEKSGVPE